MKHVRWFFLAALGLLATPTHAAELHFCHPDQGDYPWTLPDRPGLNTLLIERAAQRLRPAPALHFHAMPWARCLFKLSEGEMDGAYNASFIRSRLQMARYPMHNGQPDSSRRLMRSSYSLYQRQNDARRPWDGKTLSTPGTIGIPNGYSGIADRVRSLGGHIDQRQHDAAELFSRLLAGELDVVALKTDEAERLLQTQPRFRGIRRVSPYLAEKDFFLILAIGFVDAQPKLAEQLWTAIGLERESADYRELVRRFR